MRNRRRDHLATSPEERELREAYDRALAQLRQEEIRTSHWAKSDVLYEHLAPFRNAVTETRTALDRCRKQRREGRRTP